MMRSGGRRGNFRGTVESPFLRHRFTDARQDNLLPSLREAAAALCRNADRETLVEVVKLLEGADPRNKLARRAALQFVKDEPRTPAPAPRLPPPPPRNQQLANRETQALAAMPPPRKRYERRARPTSCGRRHYGTSPARWGRSRRHWRSTTTASNIK